MKPLHVVSVVFLLSLANSLVKAADEPSQKAEIERLRERVSKLEIELKAIRQEFAALNAVLREGAANRSRSAVTQKTLDIKVIDGGWEMHPARTSAPCVSPRHKSYGNIFQLRPSSRFQFVIQTKDQWSSSAGAPAESDECY